GREHYCCYQEQPEFCVSGGCFHRLVVFIGLMIVFSHIENRSNHCPTPRRKSNAVVTFATRTWRYRDDLSDFFGKFLRCEFGAFTSQTLETRRWRAVPGQ